jgi:transposase
MSKGKRYTEEIKNEAVKQITERGCSVIEVADRLGVFTKHCTNGAQIFTLAKRN